MPVSSPSYFPPSRANGTVVGITAGVNTTGAQSFLAGNQAGESSTSSGLIIIGYDAGNKGITGQNNAVIIGVDCAQSLFTNSGRAPNDAPIIIGYKALQNVSSADGSVIIGTNNFGQALPYSPGGNLGVNTSVVIGSEIANGANSWGANADTFNMEFNVIIGWNILPNTSAVSNPSSSVLIGQGIGYQATDFSGSNSVVIGAEACRLNIPNYCIVIGSGAATNASAANSDLIAIGKNAAPNVVSSSGTYIGANAGSGWPDTLGLMSIGSNGYNIISALANPNATGGANIAFSDQSGNVDSVTIANAVNTVFLSNGNVGTVNPVGGGYFYVNAGALHWVGSNGTDTQIAPA